MKKAHFSRFVQEGRLIEFQFEPEPMREVLNEIMRLLSRNDQRLTTIEAQIPNFVLQQQIQELQKENEELKKQMNDRKIEIDNQLKEHETKINKNIDQLTQHVDDSVSTVLVDVRRFMKSQLDDLIKAQNTNQTEPQPIQTNKDDNQLSQINVVQIKDISDIQSAVGLLQKDIANTRKIAEQKIELEMLQKELAPLKQIISDRERDILSLSFAIQGLQQRLGIVEVVHKEPVPKTELPRSQSNDDIQSKELSEASELPIPLNNQNPSISLSQQIHTAQPIIPEPPTTPSYQYVHSAILPNEDMELMDRQVRRLNELTNGFKFTLDKADKRIQNLEDTLKQTSSQTNLKQLQLVQDMDQFRSQLDRFKEQLALISGNEYSQQYNDENKKLNDGHREINEKNDNRNKVIRPEIKYVDRVLPPLMSQRNVENDNDNFGLAESSSVDNLLSNRNNKSKTQSIQSSRRLSAANSSRKNIDNEDDSSELPSPPLTPNNTNKSTLPRRENTIRIIKTPGTKGSTNTNTLEYQPILTPSVSTDEIQEKVDHAIKASISGFLDRIKSETLKEVQSSLKVVDQATAKIDQKIDREFVERMFNKFRIIISDLKEKIDQIQGTFLSWVTREELQEVLERFVEQLQEVKDTAGASSKYKCLLCGRPRTHISGMIVNNLFEDGDEETNLSENDTTRQSKKRARSRIQSPLTPKRGHTPVPRDVIQLLTSTEARK